MLTETEARPPAGRPRAPFGAIVAWLAVGYFGALLAYGTYAWVGRVTELARGGNGSTAIEVALIGSVASVLPIAVVVGVGKSSSAMRTRSAALYGLALSMFLLIVLAATFNI